MFDNAVKTSFALTPLHTLPQLNEPVQLADLLREAHPLLAQEVQGLVFEVEDGAGLAAEADKLALTKQAVGADLEVFEVVEGERLLDVLYSCAEFADHSLQEICDLLIVHTVDLLELWAHLLVPGDAGLDDGELASDAVPVYFPCVFRTALLAFLVAEHDLPSDLLGRAQLVASPFNRLRLVDRQAAFAVLLREHGDSYLILNLEKDSAFPDFLVHQSQFLCEVVQTSPHLLCFSLIGAVVLLIGYHTLKVLVALLGFRLMPLVRAKYFYVFLLFCLLKGHCRDQFDLLLCALFSASAVGLLLLVQLCQIPFDYFVFFDPAKGEGNLAFFLFFSSFLVLLPIADTLDRFARPERSLQQGRIKTHFY